MNAIFDTTNTINETKTVVFVTSHHSGHINPILSLVPRFLKAGWKIHFVSGACRKSKVQACDESIVFHPLVEVRDAVQHALDSTIGVKGDDAIRGESFPHQILPATVAYFEAGFVNRIREINADAMVCDVSALWGILAAQLLNIPVATSCSCTLFESLEPAFGFLRDINYLQASKKWLEQNYNVDYDICNSYMNESEFCIAWSFPDLQPPARQVLDGNVRFYGAAMPSDVIDVVKQQAIDNPDIAQFIQGAKLNNRKVLYCSLGTVVGQEPWTTSGLPKNQDMVADFYGTVLKLLGGSEKYQVIISIGPCRNIEDFGDDLPSNVMIKNSVPQLYVLQQADCFLTHCGNNGVHEAFFFGCPMIGIPVFGDQHPNAASIERLGAGVQIASPFAPAPSANLQHVTSTKLEQAIHRILEEPSSSTTIADASRRIRCQLQGCFEAFHSAETFEEMLTFLSSETANKSAARVAEHHERRASEKLQHGSGLAVH